VGFVVGRFVGDRVCTVGNSVGDGVGEKVGVLMKMVCVFWMLDQSQWIGQPLPYL